MRTARRKGAAEAQRRKAERASRPSRCDGEPPNRSCASTVTDDDDTNEGRSHFINTLLKLTICRAQYRFRISGVNPQSSGQFGRTPRCKSCEDQVNEGPAIDVSRDAFCLLTRHATRRKCGRAGRIASHARFRSQQQRIVSTKDRLNANRRWRGRLEHGRRSDGSAAEPTKFAAVTMGETAKPIAAQRPGRPDRQASSRKTRRALSRRNRACVSSSSFRSTRPPSARLGVIIG